MKIYKLVIAYNKDREEMEYIEESIEDDNFYEKEECVCIGTLDLSEVFEDYEDFIKHFTGEIGKA